MLQGVKKNTLERKIKIMIPGDSLHFLKPLFFILNTEGKLNLCLFIYLSIYTMMMANPRTVTSKWDNLCREKNQMQVPLQWCGGG